MRLIDEAAGADLDHLGGRGGGGSRVQQAGAGVCNRLPMGCCQLPHLQVAHCLLLHCLVLVQPGQPGRAWHVQLQVQVQCC
jgi:hypothetical protein